MVKVEFDSLTRNYSMPGTPNGRARVPYSRPQSVRLRPQVPLVPMVKQVKAPDLGSGVARFKPGWGHHHAPVVKFR